MYAGATGRLQSCTLACVQYSSLNTEVPNIHLGRGALKVLSYFYLKINSSIFSEDRHNYSLFCFCFFSKLSWSTPGLWNLVLLQGISVGPGILKVKLFPPQCLKENPSLRHFSNLSFSNLAQRKPFHILGVLLQYPFKSKHTFKVRASKGFT